MARLGARPRRDAAGRADRRRQEPARRQPRGRMLARGGAAPAHRRARRPPVAAPVARLPTPDEPGPCGSAAKRSAGSSAQVIREVQTRRPCSSVMTTSYDAMVRPRWTAVATPVTVPDGRGPVVGGVDVDADREPVGVGVERRADRAQGLGEHHRRAAVEQAVGLGVALDRHRRDDPLGGDLDQLDAHLVVERAHALGHLRRGTPRRRSRLGCSSLMRAIVAPSGPVRRCRWPRIESRACLSTDRRPPAPAPARRPLAGLPRVLRAARSRTSRPPPASTPTRSTASPRCWSTCCATSSRPTSRSPSTSRGRRSGSQEYSEYKAKRNKTPAEFSSQLPLIEQVLDALRHPLPREGGLRGRRHHRHARHPGRRREGLEVLILTGDRDSLQLVTDDLHGALPDARRLRPGPDDPEAVEAKYGVPPAALPRARGDRRGDLRQPAGRAGRRPGLRRQVDQPVRRPRQRHRPRRRDHRQEGRGAARAPRRRDPQPPAQRAGPRPRPRRSRPADLALDAVGPAGRRCTLFDELEFRATSAPGSSRPSAARGGADRRERLRAGRPAARPRRGGRLARPTTRPATPHRRRTSRAAGAPAPARSGRWRSPPPTARAAWRRRRRG